MVPEAERTGPVFGTESVAMPSGEGSACHRAQELVEMSSSKTPCPADEQSPGQLHDSRYGWKPPTWNLERDLILFSSIRTP
jgi:hypothetical protein